MTNVPNSKAQIDGRAHAGLIPGTGVGMMLLARLALALLAQALAAAIYLLRGDANPWGAAAALVPTLASR